MVLRDGNASKNAKCHESPACAAVGSGRPAKMIKWFSPYDHNLAWWALLDDHMTSKIMMIDIRSQKRSFVPRHVKLIAIHLDWFTPNAITIFLINILIINVTIITMMIMIVTRRALMVCSYRSHRRGGRDSPGPVHTLPHQPRSGLLWISIIWLVQSSQSLNQHHINHNHHKFGVMSTFLMI